VHKLESWLARYWPEVTSVLEATQASLLALLARVGGPRRVAESEAASLELLHGMSHGLLSPGKAEAVVRSAVATWGVPMLEDEEAALRALAEEAHRALRALKGAKRRVEELGLQGGAEPIAKVTGKATAAVLVHDVGDPRNFQSSRAYLKACGLNLKEKSSGKTKGRLSITKRGPSRARQYLWLAACRWIQRDSLARAWYEKKVQRDGGKKARAVVALMRKLGQGLFHVARGAVFDTARLFDASRLGATA
jgi:transposase